MASVAGDHPGQRDLAPPWMEGRWSDRAARLVVALGTSNRNIALALLMAIQSFHGDGDSCRRRRPRASAHRPWATARDVVAF